MRKHPVSVDLFTAKKLSQVIARSDQANSQPGVNKRFYQGNHGSVVVQAPSGGIPARSGTTLGKATCTIQGINKSTDAISDANDVDVYNLSETAIAGDAYVMATRDRQGNYIAEALGGSGQKEFAYARHSESLTNPRNWDYFKTTDSSFCELVNGVIKLRRKAMIHVDGTHTYKPNISDHEYPAVYNSFTQEPPTGIGHVMRLWLGGGTKTFFPFSSSGVEPFNYSLPPRWSTPTGYAFGSIGVIGGRLFAPSVFQFSFSRPFEATVPSEFTWNGTVSGFPYQSFDIDKLELSITFEEM